jgi:NADH:ubiquinone oxidoreductase subunit 2 (subunit N)
MLIMFSPYSFMFFSTYIVFLFSLFRINNFFYYWAIIEILILLFIGLSYTLFVRRYSQLITYFLIQTLASFLMLVFYIYTLPYLLTVSFLIKLSMFPFFMWYVNLIYKFPNFVFWLASTLHKIPAMLIIKMFSLELNLTLLWLSILITVLLSGLMILSILDLRMLLVISSIGNNSWFLLSQITTTYVFVLFTTVYRVRLLFTLDSFNSLSKPSVFLSSNRTPYSLSLWVLSLSGIPPFPLFYGKILVILFLLHTVSTNYFFILFLAFNSLMVIGYLQSLIKYFIYVYSCNVHYLLKY